MQCSNAIFLLLSNIHKLTTSSTSSIFATPVEIIIGTFILATCLINGRSVKSPDAILKHCTPIFFKKSALSISKGAEKNVIPTLLAKSFNSANLS